MLGLGSFISVNFLEILCNHVTHRGDDVRLRGQRRARVREPLDREGAVGGGNRRLHGGTQLPPFQRALLSNKSKSSVPIWMVVRVVLRVAYLCSD